MAERPSIHLSWQRLIDVYNDRVQALKLDTKLNSEQRLQKELNIERQILAGLHAIESALALSGAFEEEATHQ